MGLKIKTSRTTIYATPIAQKDDPADHAPIVQDARKVVQIISNDKAKLQAYCELGKLEDQVAKAEEREDTKTVETLFAKADALAQQGLAGVFAFVC
jgi:hypothetical protein